MQPTRYLVKDWWNRRTRRNGSTEVWQRTFDQFSDALVVVPARGIVRYQHLASGTTSGTAICTITVDTGALRSTRPTAATVPDFPEGVFASGCRFYFKSHDDNAADTVTVTVWAQLEDLTWVVVLASAAYADRVEVDVTRGGYRALYFQFTAADDNGTIHVSPVTG